MRKACLCAAILGLLVPDFARGQELDYVPVDRIVAVVGGVAIPLSRLEEEINIMSQAGSGVPTDSTELRELREQILSTLVEEELLVQAAETDTLVVVTDQQVQTAVDENIRSIREQYASELDFQRDLQRTGFGSPEEYRRWLVEKQRRELLRSALLQSLRDRQELRPIQPSDAELKEFFESARSEMSRRPATVTFRQIALRPKPDSSRLAAARQRADSVLRLLRGYTDSGLTVLSERFATFARMVSDELGASETGGDLGWFRRGRMVRKFDEIAFVMRPGVVSYPVLTQFGYHLILVERAEPGHRKARHILFAPEMSDADRSKAWADAEEVARRLRAGASFDSLLRLYHDTDQQSLAEDVPRDSLPQAYKDVLASRSPGQVLGPVAIDLGDGRPFYAVVVFQGEREAGEYTFEEVRERLRGRFARELALRRYIQSLRDRTYVDLRL